MRHSIGKAAALGLAIGALGAGAVSAAPGSSAAVSFFSSNDSSATRAKVADRAHQVFELDVAAAGWAGISLLRAGGEELSDLAAPSFDFKADEAAATSGGSPRLVVRLSDGGEIHVRPLAWTTTWATVDGAVDDMVDNVTGGTCGYRPMIDWETAVDCHDDDVEVTSAYLVSDSGWANGDHVLWIDDVQFDGTTYRGSANA